MHNESENCMYMLVVLSYVLFEGEAMDSICKFPLKHSVFGSFRLSCACNVLLKVCIKAYFYVFM